MYEEELSANDRAVMKKAWMKEARKKVTLLDKLKYWTGMKYWSWRYARARRAFKKTERLVGFKIEQDRPWTLYFFTEGRKASE